MKTILIILSIFIMSYGQDTTAIIILNNRFDNAWTDTLRDTCIAFNKCNGKFWEIIKTKKGYTLPYPQFLIFEE